MFRLLSGCCGLALVAAALAGIAGSAQARDLTVVGFGGSLQEAMRQVYFQPFAAAAKKPLIEESYEGGIAKIKAMVQTNAVTWDVVQMDDNEMMLACDEGLLEKFDWPAIAEGGQIRANAKQPCGVGAFVWSMVATHDPAKVQGVASWADFWDLAKYPGKRGLRKQARMTLEIALLSDGVAPADIYKVLGTEAGVARAFARLDQIKPQVQWWTSGAQPLQWLASGDVVMTAAYNGRVAAANKDGRNFKMSWLGQLYAMDFWAIVKGSPNAAEARKLVGLMMQAEPQKNFAEAIGYGVTNVEAMKLIKASLKAELPTSDANLARAVAISPAFWVDHEEDLQKRFNTWVAQ